MTEPWANFGSLSKGHVLGDRPSKRRVVLITGDQIQTETYYKPSIHLPTPYDWAKQGI